MENSIVYITTNLVNGKKYIGSHNGKYDWYKGSGVYLKKALKKYGNENFKRQILWEGDIQYMREMEEYYIDYYSAHISPLFYNISKKGIGPNTFRTKEEREQYDKRYYSVNREQILEKQKIKSKEWYFKTDKKAHYQNRAEYNKQWRLANKEKRKQWNLDNKEKLAEYNKQYYLSKKQNG